MPCNDDNIFNSFRIGENKYIVEILVFAVLKKFY